MQVTQLNDQQLIFSYLEGNEKAFEVLLTRHKAKIYTQIYLFVKDTALAEDIFQEVFIKIIDTLRKGKYNHDTLIDSLYTYLNSLHHGLILRLTNLAYFLIFQFSNYLIRNALYVIFYQVIIFISLY